MKKYQLSTTNKNYILKDAKSFFRTIQKLRTKKTKMMIQLGILFVTPMLILSIHEIPTKKDTIETTELQNSQEEIYLAVQEIIEQSYNNYTMDLQYEPAENLLVETEIVNVHNEIEQCFQYYCDIYQLDEKLVYQKAQELTNDFTDSEWLENNNIKGTVAVKKERSYSSQELGILAFIRNISQTPNNFGYTKEDLQTNQVYVSNQTLEEFTNQICSLLDYLDPNICQAIQYHESHYYTSDNFETRNNVAGLKSKDGSYRTFDNPFQSIIELAFQLEYKYLIDNGISSSTNQIEQLERIQPSYCPIPILPTGENVTEEELQLYQQQKVLNEAWLTSITSMYYDLATNQVNENINQK